MRNYFEVFGIAPGFGVDAGELEQRFIAQSRLMHPDRFVRASAREKLAALERSRELNDAYRVLRDRTQRAEYLMKLHGVDLSDDRPVGTRVAVDQEMLLEMLERNEALVEARDGGDAAEVARIVAATRAEEQDTWARIESVFAGAEWTAHLDELTQLLVKLRYHARLLEQAEPPPLAQQPGSSLAG